MAEQEPPSRPQKHPLLLIITACRKTTPGIISVWVAQCATVVTATVLPFAE